MTYAEKIREMREANKEHDNILIDCRKFDPPIHDRGNGIDYSAYENVLQDAMKTGLDPIRAIGRAFRSSPREMDRAIRYTLTRPGTKIVLA